MTSKHEYKCSTQTTNGVLRFPHIRRPEETCLNSELDYIYRGNLYSFQALFQLKRTLQFESKIRGNYCRLPFAQNVMLKLAINQNCPARSVNYCIHYSD